MTKNINFWCCVKPFVYNYVLVNQEIVSLKHKNNVFISAPIVSFHVCSLSPQVTHVCASASTSLFPFLYVLCGCAGIYAVTFLFFKVQWFKPLYLGMWLHKVCSNTVLTSQQTQAHVHSCSSVQTAFNSLGTFSALSVSHDEEACSHRRR